ncbi:Uncharacterized protein K02A2.6 [Araneus ventricosus]|uniref:Uncharacterized protein K02A2.6 n=1 Tax=Araneus ventricosus TaxID=182803 RepID=A0A4Y2F9C7_ARAVE|nr:Uncharacterized protein K02A2.6 [Araneus ventricosus]
MEPKGLNKYIKRQHYPILIQLSLFSELEGAKYFILLDACCAFLQIPLTEESSKLCAIAALFGRNKFCRLPYGLTSSPEVYQKTIENLFTGVTGILMYIDDILVYGKTQEGHDAKLKSVLDRARKHGFKLSKEKTKIKVESFKYLGFDLSKSGQSIKEDKIQALIEYGNPKNKAELQRVLVADALSRNPLKCNEDASFLEAGAAIVQTVLTASDEKTEILMKATKDDPVLLPIGRNIEEGWPENFKEVPEKVKPFWDKNAELYCYNELIFLGNRLVFPTQMKE